jgi:hypothetical protein
LRAKLQTPGLSVTTYSNKKRTQVAARTAQDMALILLSLPDLITYFECAKLYS